MSSRLPLEQEETLVKQAQQNIEAFRELYNYYFPKIYAYVSYRLGRVQDTEDLVADIFLTAVQKLDQYEWRGSGSFTGWLFRIAHNRVSDFYRHRENKQETLPLAALPDLEADTDHPIDTILQKEKFDHLRRLINTLSPRRQEIITLKFFAGLRNQEIAHLLGLNERTIAAHLCRGLADLQRKYEEALVQFEPRT
ncbi:MAG: sigma-70 family RNA polymerase sigma factor [candidate division Zixibacteria bacterium]|nr:sigma-70 family RNA polymerase sigma factor [candidate division Zixibacteria bacterium]